jgi:hypothetical protein
MRSTARSLVLTSILGALTASPLAAQAEMRFGHSAPTTVLTAAQTTFAESYVAAVTRMDIERYKLHLHSTTLACMNSDNADYFKLIFDHRIGKDTNHPRVSVERLPEKARVIDAMNARGWRYPVTPTHAFHINLVSTSPTRSTMVVFAILDDDVWYEILPCPSGHALDEMRQARVAIALEQRKR